MTATGFTDRYGLPLTTTSAMAVEHHLKAVDRLLGLDAAVDDRLAAAIAADPGFALVYAAQAGRQVG